MIDLLKRELPSHYKLHRTIVDVPYEITAEEHFDLTDRGLTSIVDYKTGIFLSIIVIGQKFRLLIMKRI